MKPKAYLETTVVSYLTARASRNPIMLGHQKLTWLWWRYRKASYDLFVSPPVIVESMQGDRQAVQRRLRLLSTITVLEFDDTARNLASTLITNGAIPASADLDALHIGIAVASGMDYLLTWNCKHIANAFRRHHIEAICTRLGFSVPIICTPEELLEDWKSA